MLEINGLSKKYLSRTAVSELNLSLNAGETCALLGPNGSGKTTLMRMIAGLIRPTAGEIRFDGAPLSVRSREKIAYMPTENYFYPYMTVRDAGKYYADFFRDFDRAKYARMLERMELNPKDRIRNLSSGMSAKLRLSLILCRDAELMMFDEPLNGVDILTRAQVIGAITENRASGRTMLISTHLVDELEPFLDHAVFMKNGVVEQTGAVAELCREHTLTELYLKIYGTGEAAEHA